MKTHKFRIGTCRKDATNYGESGEIITAKNYNEAIAIAVQKWPLDPDGELAVFAKIEPAPSSPAHTFFVMPASIRKHDVDPVRILDGDGDTLATVNAPSQTKWRDPQAVAARIAASVNACEGLSDPVAQIKALRDALENFCLLVEFSKYDFPPEILPEHKGSMIHVAWESARKALANFSKGGAK